MNENLEGAWRRRCEELRAEVERLRGENAELRKAFESDEYAIEQAREVERLSDMAAFYAKGMDKQHAEVERLRELGERSVKAHNGTINELRKATAEVERLREALLQVRLHREADMPGAADAWMYSEELRQAEAENERLQDERDAENLRADENYEVVERLRGALERLEQLAEHGYPTRSVSLEMVRHERRAALAKEEG